MEFLKKNTIILILLILFGFSASAQITPSKVFENSYAKEASGDYQDAINELAGLNGFDYHKFLRLGWLYYLDKNYEASIRYYEQAIKLRPKAVEALLGLCNPLDAQKKTDQLETTYKKILAIDPMNTK